MHTAEVFLIALAVIFSVPYLLWRIGRTEYWAPLVVVQIVTGIALGPGMLGAAFPANYEYVFQPPVVQALNGVGWWAAMLFVLMLRLAQFEDAVAATDIRLDTETRRFPPSASIVITCFAPKRRLRFQGGQLPQHEAYVTQYCPAER